MHSANATEAMKTSWLFNLQIDGVTKAVNVGNGGSTGPQVVSVGSHTVGETGRVAQT